MKIIKYRMIYLTCSIIKRYETKYLESSKTKCFLAFVLAPLTFAPVAVWESDDSLIQNVQI